MRRTPVGIDRSPTVEGRPVWRRAVFGVLGLALVGVLATGCGMSEKGTTAQSSDPLPVSTLPSATSSPAPGVTSVVPMTAPRTVAPTSTAPPTTRRVLTPRELVDSGTVVDASGYQQYTFDSREGAPLDPAMAGSAAFSSPSGNIDCMLFDQSVVDTAVDSVICMVEQSSLPPVP